MYALEVYGEHEVNYRPDQSSLYMQCVVHEVFYCTV